MDIKDKYIIIKNEKLNYIYEGLCNERQTKWITKSNWDYKISVQFNGSDLIYTDSKGIEMLVLEKNDPDDIENWEIYSRNNPQLFSED